MATLVRRGQAEPSARHAVLVVHGFTDYFFHTELADHFAARGFDVLCASICTNAADHTGRARPRTSPPT